MTIDPALLALEAGIETDVAFVADGLGLASDSGPGSLLTFLDDERFLDDIRSNPSIVAALVPPAMAGVFAGSHVAAVVVPDPRWAYYTLHNAIARAETVDRPSRIDPSADVHPLAHISPSGVVVGAGSVIAAGAVILPNVEIGERCIVQPGVVIGSPGFEHKRTSLGILSVVHDGVLQIGDEVEIAANSTVAQGFRRRPTMIGAQTKIDANVMIAHGVQIGREVFVAAGVTIAGSVTVGPRTWIGVGATIIDRILIGTGSNVGAGSVVFRDVADGIRVLGNPARPIAT